MASETADPIEWSHPPPSWAVPPERHVHSIIQCTLNGTRTCNRSMWGNHLAYAATKGMRENNVANNSLSLSLLSLSLTLPLSRVRSLALSLSLSHSRSLSLSLSLTLVRSLSLSLTLVHSLSRSLSPSFALSLSLTLVRSLSRSLSPSFARSLSLSPSFALSLSLLNTNNVYRNNKRWIPVTVNEISASITYPLLPLNEISASISYPLLPLKIEEIYHIEGIIRYHIKGIILQGIIGRKKLQLSTSIKLWNNQSHPSNIRLWLVEP